MRIYAIVFVALLSSSPHINAEDLPVSIEHELAGQLRLIPAGKFLMGEDDSTHLNERPQHEVTIEKPFYMGAHEVSFGQFRQFVSATGIRILSTGHGFDSELRIFSFPKNSPYSWRNTGFTQTDQSPVVNVMWHHAVAYCRWLSDKDGKFFRLPTELEWEYACRAETKTAYSWGNSPRKLSGRENVADRSFKMVTSDRYWENCEVWNDRFAFTAPVGSFKPNAFGLFDMHGNVSEWCEDIWVQDRYLRPPEFRPLTGKYRTVRGGSFYHSAERARSAVRRSKHPNSAGTFTGFRVVREIN